MDDTSSANSSTDTKPTAVPINGTSSASLPTLSPTLEDHKDQQLGVNRGSSEEKPVSSTAGSSEEVMIHRPNSMPEESYEESPATKPLTVTEDEVDKIKEPMDLANKIEILAGEIQTLEARIDRLASSATPLNAYPPSSPEKVEKPEEGSVPLTTPTKPAEPAMPMPTPSTSATDIYSSNENKGKQAEQSAKENQDEENHSISGGIGSLLVSLGIILLLIILALPLAKEMIGTDLFAMSQGVGWPVVLGLLGIGGVTLLFSAGRLFIKILSVLFLIVAALMYLGVLGFDSFLGPLSPIFSFYR